jgi:hypothetical protein
MKLISFDIGIKNMAYCIFEISGSLISITNWDVLNLIDENTPIKINKCNCYNKAKNKKCLPTICGKNAKFIKDDKFFCEKHAKNSNFIIPNKRFSKPTLKKLKNDELYKLCNEFQIISIEEQKSLIKKDILDKMFNYFENLCLIPIIFKKDKSASEVDLIIIGKKMKQLLNNIPDINYLDFAIIENQISPIANRMKTIQGMLAQYFIMINENIHIEFISSANKLKLDDSPVKLENSIRITENEEIESKEIESKEIESKENSYKQHKLDGVIKCSQLLEKNPEFIKWKHILDKKKKDDLADCFLQGHWYIYKKLIKK